MKRYLVLVSDFNISVQGELIRHCNDTSLALKPSFIVQNAGMRYVSFAVVRSAYQIAMYIGDCSIDPFAIIVCRKYSNTLLNCHAHYPPF